jgi:hypothetical protein
VLVLLGLWVTPLSFSGPDQAKSSLPDPSLSRETAFHQIDDDCYVVEESTGVKRSGNGGTGREQFGQERSRDQIQLWSQPSRDAQTLMIVDNRLQ